MPIESAMETEMEAIITWLLDSTHCPTDYAPLAGAQAEFEGDDDDDGNGVGNISATEDDNPGDREEVEVLEDDS